MLENVFICACMAVGSSSVKTPQQQSYRVFCLHFKYMYYVREMGLKINPYFGQNKLKIDF